jgi:hypothetical protein
MKTRLLTLSVASLTLFTFLPLSTSAQNLITFDDISLSTTGIFVMAYIPSGYQGLDWVNFLALNVPNETRLYGTNGSYYGMVSASNVVFNSDGSPAEIDSPGGNFNFLSAYMTGMWRSNLNIEVQGFSGADLLYDQTVVASATNPTLFAFNYLDIDRLTFNSFGGQSAGFPASSGNIFVMDNMSFAFVPEPSTVLLAAVGALTLCAFLKRKPG